MKKSQQEGFAPLDENEAREEAIKIQGSISGNRTPYIRKHMNFPREDYAEVQDFREYVDKIKDILRALPTEQPERKQELLQLAKNADIESIRSAWAEMIDDDAPKSEAYKNFSAASFSLFDNTDREFRRVKHDRYNFNAPSDYYMCMAYHLYDALSGKPYREADELKANFEAAVRGKKILEIAPGPGWFMKLLKDSGAKVQGIDINTTSNDVAKEFGLPIQQGEADQLDGVLDEPFDLIISNNFMNTITIRPNQARETIAQILGRLTPDGMSVHSTQSIIKPAELVALQRLKDCDDLSDVLDQLSAEGMIRVDGPVLSKDEIEKCNVADLRTDKEGIYYTFSFKKP
jgi:2-polyprenyl-3-methyl-5-hydroxy-6-metoxy-1,4-benzoquinol methylase